MWFNGPQRSARWQMGLQLASFSLLWLRTVLSRTATCPAGLMLFQHLDERSGDIIKARRGGRASPLPTVCNDHRRKGGRRCHMFSPLDSSGHFLNFNYPLVNLKGIKRDDGCSASVTSHYERWGRVLLRRRLTKPQDNSCGLSEIILPFLWLISSMTACGNRSLKAVWAIRL